MNKLFKKPQPKNSRLLQLLTRRQQNQLLPNNENDWPGIRRPSFASTIKIRNYSSATHRQSHYRQKQEQYNTQAKFQTRNLQIKKSLSLCTINTLHLHKNSDVKSKEFQLSHKKNEIYASQQSKKFEKINTKNIVQSKQRSSQQRTKGKIQKLDDYVIDYVAFNYIGKVIDNPELWQRYVHKKIISK